MLGLYTVQFSRLVHINRNAYIRAFYLCGYNCCCWCARVYCNATHALLYYAAPLNTHSTHTHTHNTKQVMSTFVLYMAYTYVYMIFAN